MPIEWSEHVQKLDIPFINNIHLIFDIDFGMKLVYFLAIFLLALSSSRKGKKIWTNGNLMILIKRSMEEVVVVIGHHIDHHITQLLLQQVH